jgi:nitroreductase
MLINIIKKRESIREYQEIQIPLSLIIKIMEAARIAPSARNLQNWKFIIITDEKIKDMLAKKATSQSFIKEAAVLIVGIATNPSYIMANGIPANYIDIAIAMEHISLLATENDIGTCWIGAFYQNEAKEILKIPKEYTIVAIMTMGYPRTNGKKTMKIRKGLDEIICFNKFY